MRKQVGTGNTNIDLCCQRIRPTHARCPVSITHSCTCFYAAEKLRRATILLTILILMINFFKNEQIPQPQGGEGRVRGFLK